MEMISVEKLGSISPLPLNPANAADGLYVVGSKNECSLTAKDDVIQYKVWFTTPPLNTVTIDRISGLQLHTECHDQGFADNPSAGNWTWIELAILESSNDTSPKVRDGVTLAWTSQYNRFLTNDFDWSAGSVFGEQHELLGQLETGNVIAIRLCARFPAWEITTRNGYLVIHLEAESPRKIIDYKPIVESITTIQTVFKKANSIISPAFVPQIGPEVFVANSFSSAEEKPLRVLSLDGGGVRGISSLYILKEVMNKLTNGKQDVRPCEVFDMIAGTSTGGLIAIMLGRLGMTIDECIADYHTFAQRVFKSGWFGKTADFVVSKDDAFYDANELENVIKDCVKRKIGNTEANLLDDNNKCKVFVMAVREDAVNNRGPVFLRSYTNPQKLSLLPECKIWEAGRATSAAPVYFKPIQVGKYKLVDGGLSANNPIGWLWNECIDVFGTARASSCFMSIGTGIPQNKSVGTAGVFSQKELADGLASAATNSQLAHLLFQTVIDAYAPKSGSRKYWRFNISEEVPEYETKERDGPWYAVWKYLKEKKTVLHLDNYKNVGELDDVEMMKELINMTIQYTDVQQQDIVGCVEALRA